MTALAVCLAMLLPYAFWTMASAMALAGRRRAATRLLGSDEPLTVVVCTAHEPRETLERCLVSLTAAMSDDDRLIVVTDHVEPSLTSWLQERWEGDKRVCIVANTSPKGKKFAQRTGVGMARTRAVATIDADCHVGPAFIDTLRRSVPAGDFMLLLPVVMRGSGLWGRMIEMEFVCLQTITAGSAILRHPTMANGAGMAFSRDLFVAHDQRLDVASGDDMFLLGHAIASGAKIDYAAHPDALVETSAPPTIGAYVRQRARWLGKAGCYERSKGHGAVIALAWSVLAAVAAWPSGAALAAMGLMGWDGAAAVFGAKLTLDLLTYVAGRGLMGSGVGLWAAVPLEAAYPFMTAVVGLRAALRGRKAW